MANYKMILQYDGTRYRGWQVLPAELTIQGKLQDVLSKMAGYQVEVTGSGRTDAGVHAKGQTANFHLREEWDEDKILFYLNQYLPEDIAVCEVKRVDERFHSRYQAVEKTYLYRIHTGKIPEVFERRYVYDYTEPLDVNRMRKAAEYLKNHEKVAWVSTPELPGDKYYDLAQKYLPNGTCGVITFGVKGGRDAAVRMMDALKMIAIVTHVADARSCVLHPASHTHRQMNDEELREAGVQPDLIRFSVGLENIEDIIADLEQALQQV